MQFNPSDKSKSLIADIDFLLFGTSEVFNSEYSIADRTRNINTAYDEAIAEMFRGDPNWQFDDNNNTDFPIASTDIVANRDHYTTMDEALIIHRVRMMDNQGKFITLDPVSKTELSDDELNTTGVPEKYYKIGNGIFPIPVPNYSADDGVELQFQRGGNYFSTSDTTKSPGFNSQYHRFLSAQAALVYAVANGMEKRAAQIRAILQPIVENMRDHYQSRSKDERPRLTLKKKSINSYGL